MVQYPKRNTSEGVHAPYNHGWTQVIESAAQLAGTPLPPVRDGMIDTVNSHADHAEPDARTLRHAHEATRRCGCDGEAERLGRLVTGGGEFDHGLHYLSRFPGRDGSARSSGKPG